MIYSLIICIASTCTTHSVTAFGADGFGNAYYIENGARFDCANAQVSLTGQGGTITASACRADDVFGNNFE